MGGKRRGVKGQDGGGEWGNGKGKRGKGEVGRMKNVTYGSKTLWGLDWVIPWF